MYKFANPEHTVVNNLSTGEYGIHPGVHLWEQYLEWVALGGVTEPFQTAEEIINEVKWGIKSMAISRRYSGILVGTVWVPTDADSRIEYLVLKDLARDLYAAGQGLDAPIIVDGDTVEVEAMDGTMIQATIRKVKALMEALQVLDRRLRRVANYHISQMQLAPDPLQYDYSTGWPPSYPG